VQAVAPRQLAELHRNRHHPHLHLHLHHHYQRPNNHHQIPSGWHPICTIRRPTGFAAAGWDALAPRRTRIASHSSLRLSSRHSSRRQRGREHGRSRTRTDVIATATLTNSPAVQLSPRPTCGSRSPRYRDQSQTSTPPIPSRVPALTAKTCYTPGSRAPKIRFDSTRP
jgi:hypothetical protein